MATNISKTAVIYPNVTLGKDVIIEDYCIIGYSSIKHDSEHAETIIGDNAHLRSHVVIYSGNVIGKNFHAGHKANIREHNKIGNHVSIGTLSVVEHHVEIFDRVKIHTQAFIPEYSVLQEDAWIGPNVVLTNAMYPNSKSAKKYLQGPMIGTGAKIGANSTLLPGIEIGANSLVGAGSVVTKDVPTDVVVAGNSAITLKSIKDLPY